MNNQTIFIVPPPPHREASEDPPDIKHLEFALIRTKQQRTEPPQISINPATAQPPPLDKQIVYWNVVKFPGSRFNHPTGGLDGPLKIMTLILRQGGCCEWEDCMLPTISLLNR